AVAGFVVPGMRVDGLVTGRPPNDSRSTMTTTLLQNMVVLSAGQSIQPDAKGQAIQTPVVTLLVTPEHAEILTLGASEGRIRLVLRNAVDQKVEKTPGKELNELYGLRKVRTEAPAPRRPRPVTQI